MARPEVAVYAPDEVYVGQPFELRAEVAAPTAASIESIRVIVTGVQGWAVGSGKSRVRVEEKVPELGEYVMGEAVFAAGEHRTFRCTFVLPPGTAPSHELAPAYARLKIRVHVSLPWRIDVRHDVVLAVRLSPIAVERTPALVSAPPGAAPGEPRLEVALSSSRVVIGEPLRGTVAVFHLDATEPREITIAVVPQLRLHDGRRGRDSEPTRFRATVTLPARSAGASIPFEVDLPDEMVPSFTTITHSLAWRLEVHTGSFFRGKVSAAIALDVIDAAAARHAAALPPPPQLADRQIVRAFRLVAASGEPALLPGGRGVTETAGETTVTVEYDDRGREEAVLVSRLDHPPLGLGLRVVPSLGLRALVMQDLELDIRAWDRDHFVDARHAEQALPFLRAVVAAWPPAGALGTLARWTDTDLVFERAVTAVDPTQVTAQLDALVALAAALATARASIGPPPGVITDLPAWQTLAEALDGQFSPGDLALSGTYGNQPVETSYTQTEQHHVLDVAVGSPATATAKIAAVELTLTRPARASGVGGLDDETAQRVVAVLQRMPLDIANLVVAGGVARASLVLEHAAAIDPDRIRTLVDGLRAVLGALDVGPAPYR